LKLREEEEERESHLKAALLLQSTIDKEKLERERLHRVRIKKEEKKEKKMKKSGKAGLVERAKKEYDDLARGVAAVKIQR
jgi:hypothetical protein